MFSNSQTVLLVEDSVDDVDLTVATFRRTNRKIDVKHVENGSECMKYLRKQGSYADSPTPDLILLDLNMPVMDGREVLAEVKQDPALNQLPVVVLSTSNAMTDVAVSYQLGCRSYLVKPVDFHKFQRLVDNLCVYWFDTALLPPKI